MLKTHPQVFMPRIKEPRFLGSDLRPRQGHEQAVREQGYPKTMAEYLALFDDAQPGQRAGEATPIYLWSKSAPDAIAALQPDARIIAILREPASFLRSLHLSFILGHNEGERDLRKAMSLEDARRAGKQIPRSSHRPQLLQYSEHVRYVEQLSRYHARFSADQILVLIYDDFRRDNEGTLRAGPRVHRRRRHGPDRCQAGERDKTDGALAASCAGDQNGLPRQRPSRTIDEGRDSRADDEIDARGHARDHQKPAGEGRGTAA